MPDDELLLDSPTVREFLAGVRRSIARAGSPAEACDAIRPGFASLLADPEWLPARFREPAPESGMGGGIGQWLLFRAADRSLTLFSLVVPPGAQTPVHDHLAWGLVDRKSTRLNSSHANISYAVFCLKKKKTKQLH